MPKIQWSHLPPALRDHLFDRLRERKITVEDLYQLKQWRESEPDAPDGLWYKDFGSFKVWWRRQVSEDVLAERTGGEGAEALRDALAPRSPAPPASPCAASAVVMAAAGGL